MSICYEPVENLLTLIKDKRTKPSDVVRDIYDAIEEIDPTIKSLLALDKKNAIEKARELGGLQAKGQMDGKLFGTPMGIKDNTITNGLETICASKMLEGFVPIYESIVMEKPYNENAALIGELNMDEFAMGGSTGASYFKKIVNPLDHKAVPGGSPDGSAAAIAAGLVPLSLGSDTGGSVRQPAAYCGAVGVKPTYGRVSRFGLVASALSLDQIGPPARNAKDNAIVLEAISGVDVNDSTGIPVGDVDSTSEIGKDIEGLKVALPKKYLGEGVASDVKEAVQNAVETLKSLGAVVREASLSNAKSDIPSYYAIASSEAPSNPSHFDGIRYGYHSKEAHSLEELYGMSRSEGSGKEVKRRIFLGTFALSSGYHDVYYKKFQKVRISVRDDFDKVFENYDVVAGPTASTTVFNSGEEIDGLLIMYANDLLTTPVNLAGLPGIFVPCGQSDGRPIGLQFISKSSDEKTLYRVAYQHEIQYNLHNVYEKL